MLMVHVQLFYNGLCFEFFKYTHTHRYIFTYSYLVSFQLESYYCFIFVITFNFDVFHILLLLKWNIVSSIWQCQQGNQSLTLSLRSMISIRECLSRQTEKSTCLCGCPASLLYWKWESRPLEKKKRVILHLVAHVSHSYIFLYCKSTHITMLECNRYAFICI